MSGGEAPEGEAAEVGNETMQLSVRLNGDQRRVESLVLEVRAMARRHGLELAEINVTRA